MQAKSYVDHQFKMLRDEACTITLWNGRIEADLVAAYLQKKRGLVKTDPLIEHLLHADDEESDRVGPSKRIVEFEEFLRTLLLADIHSNEAKEEEVEDDDPVVVPEDDGVQTISSDLSGLSLQTTPELSTAVVPSPPNNTILYQLFDNRNNNCHLEALLTILGWKWDILYATCMTVGHPDPRVAEARRLLKDILNDLRDDKLIAPERLDEFRKITIHFSNKVTNQLRGLDETEASVLFNDTADTFEEVIHAIDYVPSIQLKSDIQPTWTRPVFMIPKFGLIENNMIDIDTPADAFLLEEIVVLNPERSSKSVWLFSVAHTDPTFVTVGYPVNWVSHHISDRTLFWNGMAQNIKFRVRGVVLYSGAHFTALVLDTSNFNHWFFMDSIGDSHRVIETSSCMVEDDMENKVGWVFKKPTEEDPTPKDNCKLNVNGKVYVVSDLLYEVSNY